MKPADVIELKPHVHGNWKVIKHITDLIETTSKDSAERTYVESKHSETIWKGTLSECE